MLLREFHDETLNGRIPSYESASIFQSQVGQRIYHQILNSFPNGFHNLGVEEILHDPDLFQCYLSAVQDPEYYFSDCEIELAAYLFDKQVSLCEYNYSDNQYYVRPMIYNEAAEDFVLIAYNGYKHYERCVPR